MKRLLQNKKHLLVLLFAILMSASGMRANPVDMNAAREVAVKFMNANAKAPMRGIDNLQLVTTYSINRGDAAFYVINTPNGFVIISADDRVTPILGYSEEGQFDVENIPIQMQDYLQGFVEQIQYVIENQIEADEQTTQQWELVRTTGRLTNSRSNRTVEPLITATWDQGCYYNEKCPVNGNGECGHVLTGCVATAMAQIIHYWGYPEHGTGSHSYKPTGYPVQNVNFGATTYDWDNMPDQLDYYSSSEQIDAVSTLMWHCGVSVDMMYGPDASGAFSSDVTEALTNFFNYSDEMNRECLSNYNNATWKAKLKDCLNLNRPLYYDGSSSMSGGHAFVCDGYDNNDMFHFNWGWSGGGNGYYAIGALNVNVYFMYHFDFSNSNCAIFNIHPQGEITNYVISISVNNDEGGTAAGGGIYAHGDNVTLSAMANDGYGFCYWEENGEIVSTNPNYSFTANYNRSLVAVFAEPFTVTISAEEGGTVSGGGTYYYGESCLAIATANEGYGFSYWTENGEVISYNDNYSFTVTGERHLIAHFAELEGNIVFADDNVKVICVTNWDTNNDGMLSYAEAASVTSLGEVFRYKTSITSFEELQYFIGLTTIGSYAFQNCSGLLSLIIPNTVNSIGNYAFYNCSSLVSLTISNTVNSIGNYAFYNCSSLVSLAIPNAVTSIGEGAFGHCSNLSGDLVIPNSVTSIGSYAFYYCSALTSLTLGNSVTSIGSYAFQNCNGFSYIISLAETPPTLDSDVFYNLASSIPVYVPCGFDEAYTSLSWGGFSRIAGLCGGTVIVTAVPYEGGTVTGGGSFEIGQTCTITATANENYTFIRWTHNNIMVSTDVEYTFFVTGDMVLVAHFVPEGNIVFTDANVKSICVSHWDTDGDGELSYVEAALVTNLGYYFKNNNEITSFEELQYFIGLTNISDYAFSNCSGLNSIIIPNTVSTIGRSAFEGCSSLSGSLTIPNSVISIGNYAFEGCSGFTGNLIIPSSVTRIGTSAFWGCSGFTSIVSFAETPPIVGSYAFVNWNQHIPVYVPCGFENAYISLSWGGFSHYHGMCGGTVTVAADPEEGGSVTGGGTFVAGQPFTVTATASGGYVFAFWTLNGIKVSNNVEYTFYVAGDLTLVAHFVSEDNIEFADVNVKSICVANWDTNGDGELSYAEASLITTLGEVFRENVDITSFEELQYFIGLQSINNNAFRNCTSLSGALIIPNFVTSIGNYAFYNCSGLSGSPTISNSVTSIGNYAFYNCSGLTGSLNIPNSVTSMGNYAFYNCSGFTGSLVISNSVTRIGNYAFSGCNGFTGSLTIPNSVTSIGERAFYNCSGFNGSLTIPNSVNSIGDNAFRNCSGLTGDFAIPNSVTLIGKYAFSGCSGFTGSLTIPNSVTSMGEGAFSHCSGLTGSLVIPNSLTAINKFAFYYCSGITGSLIIPNSVTIIDENAFNNCSGFNGSLTLSNSITLIADQAFYGCSGLTGSLSIPNSVVSIGSYAFYNCSGLSGNLTIPNSVSFIGESAFCNCSGLTGSLIIPNTITSIGSYTFRGCSGFTGLLIPNSVTEIDFGAFYECSGLTGDLLIPNSVTSIDSYAFYNCSGLTGSLTIPNSVNSIGNNAFRYCRGLKNLIVLAEIPPTLESNVFSGVPTNTPVYVPCESIEAYQSAEIWNNFYNIIGMCSSGTITVVSEPSEGGVVTGAGVYEPGTLCTVTASPNENYTFMYWTENDIVVSAQAEYTFAVPANRNLVAHFALPFSVTASANPTEGGTVNISEGVYDYGSPVTLTATANAGYSFINWTENGMQVSMDATYSFNVTGDRDLVANFIEGHITVIGDGGVSVNYFLPSCSFNRYTLSQQIYTSDEIGMAGTITSVSYFNEGGTKTRSYDIYMVHTDKMAFDSNSDWIPVTEADRVFSGSVSMTQGYWTTIVLNTPFEYNGTSNLAIVFDDNTGSYSSDMACRVFNANGYQAIRIYSNGTNYDPYNPSSYVGTRHTVKNQIILGITPSTAQQTITLSQGTNWFSTYIDITLEDLQNALVEALPGTTITIKSQNNGQTIWNGHLWVGTLRTLDLAQMYKISVASACEITLEGLPVNPAEHPLTINNGSNWIGFPLGESMTVTNAFADFATPGDIIKSDGGGQAIWNGHLWVGLLKNLESGKGYIYNSAATESRIFTFPTSAK